MYTCVTCYANCCAERLASKLCLVHHTINVYCSYKLCSARPMMYLRMSHAKTLLMIPQQYITIYKDRWSVYYTITFIIHKMYIIYTERERERERIRKWFERETERVECDLNSPYVCKHGRKTSDLQRRDYKSGHLIIITVGSRVLRALQVEWLWSISGD